MPTHLIRFQGTPCLVRPGAVTAEGQFRLCWVTAEGAVVCMDGEPDFVLEIATIEEKML